VGRAVDIPLIPVFEPLLRPARYKGLYGGRGGAKSHAFADLLIDDCITHPGLRAVCIREYQVSLEQSVKRLLEDKIKQYGLTREFRVMDACIETPGDGIIIFLGMQAHNAESIKSLEGYDRAWVEEAQNLSQRSLNMLLPTIRKEKCRYCRKEGPLSQLIGVPCKDSQTHLLDPSEIWFSWNPRNQKDPVDEMLRKDPPPDAIVIKSSYRDNPFFPDVLRKEMEWDRKRDPDKYNHVWDGGYERRSESRVFKNWKEQEFETPSDVAFLYGADWGYSVDPTVLVRCFVKGRQLFIDREAYEIGCEIDNLPHLFDKIPGCREWTITADSARPETISHLQRHGFPKMVAAVKGKDSVKEGVIFLQNFDIVVHPRCVHTIDELCDYAYKVDPRTDKVVEPPVLEDKKNHVIDSLRYAVERLRADVFDYKEAGMTSEATW
jgi:phage terminase large subunit